jgi:hypothetical protein
MMKFRSINTFEQSHIARVSAGVSADHQFSLYDLLLNQVHILFLNEFLPPRDIFDLAFEVFPRIGLSRVFLFANLYKYFVGLKYALVVDHADKDTGIFKRDSRSLFYGQGL